jgi:dihydrofolate reductase
MKHFKAIAAMSENRVIGQGGKIPWHLPADFKWFKKMTMGNITLMGRKTFETIGKPLPNRTNLILTHHPQRLIRTHPSIFGEYKEWRSAGYLKRPYQLWFSKLEGIEHSEILICGSLKKLNPTDFKKEIFICGGAQIYEQILHRCSDLYLTVVKRQCEGDAFFPKFEDQFRLHEEREDNPEFRILHYRHRSFYSE